MLTRSTSGKSGRRVFPGEMTFRLAWRTYQQRLLDRLDSFLDDYVAAAAAVAAIASLPGTVAALWRLIRHGTPERSIRQIGMALLESLQREGSIGEPSDTLRVAAHTNADGAVQCRLDGATSREQQLYLHGLREVLRPVENPRYLLAQQRWWRWFREDYFAVPDVLARKKEFATRFATEWRRRVGRVRLVYTRTPEGRKVLLRARTHSLAATFQKRADRVSCWR